VKCQPARRVLSGAVVLGAALAFAGLVPISAVAAVHPAVAIAAPGAFVAVDGGPILNTFDGTGLPKSAVPAQATVKFTVAGTHGVPSNAAAVVLNVRVSNEVRGGYLTFWPAGQARPNASNLNYAAELAASNRVTVAIGSAGQVDLFNGSGGKTDLVADLQGYYIGGSPADPGMFVSLAPKRVLDTRIGTGAAKRPVAAAGTLNVSIGGAASSGVPSNAKAVVMNVTTTAPTKGGYLTTYPTGGVRPTTSSLNFTAASVVANQVTVGLGSTGRVSFYNGSSGTLQLVADVAGYYIGGAATEDGAFVPVTPGRILDSRIGLGVPTGPITSPGSVGFQVVGSSGVPLSGVGAVAMNVTLTQESRAGSLSVAPTGEDPPGTEQISYLAGVNVANAAVEQPGACSKLQMAVAQGGTVQLLVDVAGYFIDADTPPLTDPTKPALLAWGTNGSGELGDGTTTASAVPQTVLNVPDAKAMSGGDLALTNGGGVYSWGPQNLALVAPDLAGDHGYRNCSLPAQVPGLPPHATAVAGTPSDAFVRDSFGDIWGWGYNTEDQLGFDDEGQPAFGVETITGFDDNDVLAIGAGVAIRTDHTLWTWGPNDRGQLGTGETAAFTAPTAAVTALGPHVQAVTQLGQTNYALLDNGTVWAMGDNTAGALGNGSPDTATPFSNVPVQVKGVGGVGFLTGVVSIGPGAAVLADHTLVTWGTNAHGRLGIGTTVGSSDVPVAVAEPVGMPTVSQVDSAPSNMVALGSDGTVWAWGAALADGRSADSGTPAQIAGLVGVTSIAAGPGTAFAVMPPTP
jgi:hypothetical protein